MVKWLKIILSIFSVVLVVLITTTIVIHFAGFKGQKASEIDINSSGESTEIEGNTKLISDCTPKEALYVCNAKFKDLESYHASITGEVLAFGGIYKQTVSGDKYSNSNGSLYITKSTSVFVSVAKQFFIKDNQVQIRVSKNINNNTWNDETTKSSLSDFLNEYGVDFRELTNYILNNETIISSTLKTKEGLNYTYSFDLNPAKATIGYRVNMAKMGGLPSLPEFSSCKIEITMNENFEPISLTCFDEYKVEKFGGLGCTSTLTLTFDKLNKEVEIPDLKIFNPNSN